MNDKTPKFNPYHKILGIPADKTPPNFYVLLGVALFEDDTEIISNAAGGRIMFLRSMQTGKYAEHVHGLLNEVSKARACLLNPDQKREYDRQLEKEQTSQTSQPARIILSQNPQQTRVKPRVESLSPRPSQTRIKPRVQSLPPRPSQTRVEPRGQSLLPRPLQTWVESKIEAFQNTKVIVGASVGGVVLLLLFFLILSGGEKNKKVADTLSEPEVSSIVEEEPSVPEPVDETAINEARAMIDDTPSEPEVSSIVEEEPSVPEPVDETAINEARAMIDDTFRTVQNMKEDAPTEARELLETLYYNLDPYVFTKEEYQTHRNKIQTAIDEMKKLEEERVAGRKATREAGARMVKTVDGVEYAFRWCPPGEFMMGSPESEEERWHNLETQHRVTLTKGFWMLETEVTQAMWESVMGTTVEEQAQKMLWDDTEYDFGPLGTKTNRDLFGFKRDRDPSSILCGVGDKLPMYYVNWNESREFCRRLSDKLGAEISLPTEAQWEYACRAGTTTPFNFGSTLNGDKANCCGIYPYGTSTKGTYHEKTVAVKSYAPNAWGLYDMHGNVFEWCQDWIGYYPTNSVTDPTGLTNGSNRVDRGGSWVRLRQGLSVGEPEQQFASEPEQHSGLARSPRAMIPSRR